MTLSPDTILKLAKMIPCLSSDHAGEVVATAHAIQRTLQSSGRDWHDWLRISVCQRQSFKFRTPTGAEMFNSAPATSSC
jgi:hypothetical protein